MIFFKKYFSALAAIIFLGISLFFILRKNPVPNTNNLNQIKPDIQSQTSISDFRNIKFVEMAGKTLKVEIASTPEDQAQGLSGRKNLKSDEGMLFVFDHSERYSFWMKDMKFPIDIIWIGEDLRIKYIKENALPESYPNTFTSTKDSKYVLEVVSNFSSKNKLKERDKVEFLP